MNYTIYMLVCETNGKLYVGLTKNSIEQRFKEHKIAAARGSTLAIHRAINKYGADKFFAVRIGFATTHEDALIQEQTLIKKFETRSEKGYNLCDGGRGSSGYKRTLVQKEAQSIRAKAVWADPVKRASIIEKLRAAAKNRFKNADERVKVSLAAKKRFEDPEQRKLASEKQSKVWATNKEYRTKKSEHQKKWYAANRERQLAHLAVGRAVRAASREVAK
jgi:group I intron endonuclease